MLTPRSYESQKSKSSSWLCRIRTTVNRNIFDVILKWPLPAPNLDWGKLAARGLLILFNNHLSEGSQNVWRWWINIYGVSTMCKIIINYVSLKQYEILWLPARNLHLSWHVTYISWAYKAVSSQWGMQTLLSVERSFPKAFGMK